MICFESRVVEAPVVRSFKMERRAGVAGRWVDNIIKSFDKCDSPNRHANEHVGIDSTLAHENKTRPLVVVSFK